MSALRTIEVDFFLASMCPKSGIGILLAKNDDVVLHHDLSSDANLPKKDHRNLGDVVLVHDPVSTYYLRDVSRTTTTFLWVY